MEFRWENLAIFVGGLAPVIAVAGIVIDQEVTKSGTFYSPEVPPPPPPWPLTTEDIEKAVSKYRSSLEKAVEKYRASMEMAVEKYRASIPRMVDMYRRSLMVLLYAPRSTTHG